VDKFEQTDVMCNHRLNLLVRHQRKKPLTMRSWRLMLSRSLSFAFSSSDSRSVHTERACH